MLGLYVLAAVPVACALAGPWLRRIGERRLRAEELRLQALYGQVRSELRAEAWYR